MNPPNLRPDQGLTGEPTATYQDGAEVLGRSAEAVEVALAPRSGPQPTSEIQLLLRKRLRFFALLIACFYGVLLPRTVRSLVNNGTASADQMFIYQTFKCFVLLTVAGLAGVLCRKKPLAVAQLRSIELILFGIVMLQFAWVDYNTLFVEKLPALLASRVDDHRALLVVGAQLLTWFVLVVGYGVLIPNTLRRCIFIVGVISVTPLVISTVASLAVDAIPRHLLPQYLVALGTWMAITAAIAVYGSHHIEALRQEAFAARQLGQYRLKQRLGVGGMGEVYLAEHVLLRRPCALKLIRPERAGDPANLARFEREVRTTATLTHPNTVQIFDYGRADDGSFYYTMEYLPGLTLEELVKRHGPLPPARAVHLLRQVCGALQEAHAAGLIHRDIKPSNVIVCERGGVHDVTKLLDFGLVRDISLGGDETQVTQEGTFAGTPAYTSPEQASGGVGVDARSDIYSVGALAYFLVTGQPPFVGRSALKTLAAHLYESPAPLIRHSPNVPAEVEDVVLRCLAKRPVERFPDVESLEAALAKCNSVGQWSSREAGAWWRSNHGADRARVPTAESGEGEH